MTTYSLYQRRNLITPFMTIAEDTINTSSTNMYFVGHNVTGYGQPEQQDMLWLLENNANSTAPSPAILGQTWYNTTDSKLYVCTNQGTQTFTKVNNPIVSGTTPSGATQGDLWYNTADGRLYAYTGSTWIVIGPISNVPVAASGQNFIQSLTTDGTPTQMFVNGVLNSRMVVPINTTWFYDIQLVARTQITSTEVVCMNFRGVVDRPNSGVPSLIGGQDPEIFNISGTLAGTVTAVVSVDGANNALVVTVTGQAGKTILWNAICNTTIVSNT